MSLHAKHTIRRQEVEPREPQKAGGLANLAYIRERDKETLSKQGERWNCVLRPSLTAATHIGFHRLPTSLDQSAEKCLTSNLKLGANQSKPARPCLSKSKKIIKYLK